MWRRLEVAAAIAVAVIGLTVPANAGAWGFQTTVNQPVAPSGEDDIDFTAAGDIWYGSASTAAVYRLNRTGTVLQTIGTQGVVHALAVNRANGDVFAVAGNGPGNGPNDAVYQYHADGSFARSFNNDGTFNSPVRLHRIAVNSTTGAVYVASDQQILQFDNLGAFVGAINLAGASDVEVEPATGDVLVAVGASITRYSASLTDPQPVLTEPGNAPIVGLGVGVGGTIWTSTNDCIVRQFASSTQELRNVNVGCASYFSFHGLEADARNGAYVMNSGGPMYYAATAPPVASFTANPGGPVHRGQHVDFASTSSDPDGTIVATTWDLNDDGDFSDASGTTSGTSFGTAGDHAVRMRVTDDEQGTATRTLVVHVDDQAPIASFATDPTTPQTGDTIALTSTSSDPDGTIAQTDWDLDDNGTFEASGTQVTTTFASSGDHTVHIRVTDDSGNVVTADRTITVAAPGAALPRLSAGDASVSEGASGATTYLQFPVTLSSASAATVSVTYETTAGTATDGVDYSSRSQSTLTFAAGQTTKTVRVPVYGDDVDEPDETVGLALSDPSGATIARANATGTIVDDDAPGNTTTTTATTTATTTVAPLTTVVVTPTPAPPSTTTPTPAPPSPPPPPSTHIHLVLTGDGAGTVRGLGATACRDICDGTFADTSAVTLTATPAAGARFTGFTGCATTSAATCAATPSTPGTSVSASFAPEPRTLVVDREGDGSATVRSADGLIRCGSDCSNTYSAGTTVRLHATLDPTSTLVRWRNCSPATGLDCTATVDAQGTGVALVTRRTKTELQINLTGAAPSRAVQISGPGTQVTCSSTCTQRLDLGNDYVLHPNLADDVVFGGWHGCDELRGGDCVVHAAGRTKSVSAEFEQRAPLEIHMAGSGRGIVHITGTQNQTCAADCVVPATTGDDLVLTTEVRAGEFAGWSPGTCTTRRTTDGWHDLCGIHVRAATTVTAQFDRTPDTQVTVAFDGAADPGDGQYLAGRNVEFDPAGDALGAQRQACYAGSTGTCSVALQPGFYNVAARTAGDHAQTVGEITAGCTTNTPVTGCVLRVSADRVTLRAHYRDPTYPVTVRFDGATEGDDGAAGFGRHVAFLLPGASSPSGDCFAGQAGVCTVHLTPGVYLVEAKTDVNGAHTAGHLTSGCTAPPLPGDDAECHLRVGSRPVTLAVHYSTIVTPVRVHFQGAPEPVDGQDNSGRLVRFVAVNGLGTAAECLAGSGASCEVQLTKGLYRLDATVRSDSGATTKGVMADGCTQRAATASSCFLAVGDSPLDVTARYSPIATTLVRVHFEGAHDPYDGTAGLGRVVALDQQPPLPDAFHAVCRPSQTDTCEMRVPPGTYDALGDTTAAGGARGALTAQIAPCGFRVPGLRDCYLRIGNGAVDVTARYGNVARSLTIAFSGGGGAATLVGPGVACRSASPQPCTTQVDVGDPVRIAASVDPTADPPFAGWSGCGDLTDHAGATPVCTFTMPDADKTVTLNYDRRHAQVEVSFEGGDGDRRVSFPAPLNRPACSSVDGVTCTRSFDIGQAPTLVGENAIVDQVVYRFDGWRGCGPRAGIQHTPTCTLPQVTAGTQHVTAVYAPLHAKLHLQVEGATSAQESVWSGTSGSDFRCGADVIAAGKCDRDVVTPALLQLTPHESDASRLRFKQWRGPCLDPDAVRAFAAVVTIARTVAGASLGGPGGAGVAGQLDANGQLSNFNDDTCFIGVDGDTSVTAVWERSPSSPTLPSRPLTVTVKGGEGTRSVKFSTDTPDCLAAGGSQRNCTNDFSQGELVTLRAVGSSSSRLKSWDGCFSPTDQCVVSAGAVRTVTATFETKTLPMHLHISGGDGIRRLRSATDATAADLTRLAGGEIPADLLSRFPIVCSAPGNDPCTQTRDRAQPLAIVAGRADDADAKFDHWSDPACGRGPVCVIRAQDADGLTAYYVRRYAPLAIGVSGASGARKVTVAAPGATPAQTKECVVTSGDGACDRAFLPGTPVTLTASADSGANAGFDHWSGACQTPAGAPAPATCTVPAGVVDRVTAVYHAINHTLTIKLEGGIGDRTVEISGAGSCNADDRVPCTRVFAPGRVVDLRQRTGHGANAAAESISGCLPVPFTQTCRLVMPPADVTVTAQWHAARYVVHIRFAGPSHVRRGVESDDGTYKCFVAELDDVAACDNENDYGARLTLTDNADYTDDTLVLDHWSGPCGHTPQDVVDGTCTVNPTVPEQTVTAHFAKTTRPLHIVMTGGDGGRLVRLIGGDVPDCSDTCTRDASRAGALLQATAGSARDSQFDHWTGCAPVPATTMCAVDPNVTDSVTAVYTRRWSHVHIRFSGGSGDREVSVTGAASCNSHDGAVCDRTFLNTGAVPDVVTLATPARIGDSVLSGFSGCPSPSVGPHCAFPAGFGRDYTVTANFVSARAHIDVQMSGGRYGRMAFTPTDHCNGPCGRDVVSLQVVTATATGRNGGLFRSWEHCPGVETGSVCTFVAQPGDTMIRAKYVGD